MSTSFSRRMGASLSFFTCMKFRLVVDMPPEAPFKDLPELTELLIVPESPIRFLSKASFSLIAI